MEVKERPLITIFVYAYNHSQFIKEAVLGAFNQSYSNLEIILSDDCSTDGTFEIMKEMVEQYQGPHKLILNRNENNLGISAHLNKITSIGSGDWFVLCAGDDISMPERVEQIVSIVEKYNDAKFVATGLNVIDASGNFLYYQGFDDSHPYITGASGVWHRSCFDFFGPITKQSVAEDIVIPFRASLLGKIILIDKPTVSYRLHSNSMSSPQNQDYLQSLRHLYKIKFQVINAVEQRLSDLEVCKHEINDRFLYESLFQCHNSLINELRDDKKNIKTICDVMESSLRFKLLYLLKKGVNKHESFFYRLKIYLYSFSIVNKMLTRKKTVQKEYHISGREKVIELQDLISPDTGILIYQ